jgi:hypothetical protein
VLSTIKEPIFSGSLTGVEIGHVRMPGMAVSSRCMGADRLLSLQHYGRSFLTKPNQSSPALYWRRLSNSGCVSTRGSLSLT